MPALPPEPNVRPMTPTDVDPAAALMLAGGWSDRRPFLAFAVAHPGCRTIVAELDGRVVGTGVGTVSGRAGWVGAIFVDAELRGRGIGRVLTERVISDLRSADCETLVLVASAEGRPMYERISFETRTTYVMLEASGTGAATDARQDGEVRRGGRLIRPFAAADLGIVRDLDRAATGEDRGHLIEALAGPENTRCVVRAGTVRAFLARPPWGGGALIAPDPDDAIALLDDRRARAPLGHRVRTGVPATNERGIHRLLDLGWKRTFDLPRMERGPALDWRPIAIWGQFNFAVG